MMRRLDEGVSRLKLGYSHVHMVLGYCLRYYNVPDSFHGIAARYLTLASLV